MNDLYYIDAYRFKPLRATPFNTISLDEAIELLNNSRKKKFSNLEGESVYSLKTQLVFTPGVQLHPKKMYLALDDPAAEFVTLPDLRTMLPEGITHFLSFFRLLKQSSKHLLPEYSEQSKPTQFFINAYRFNPTYVNEVCRMYDKCFQVPMVTSSIFNQQKGKKNICRQTLSKKRGYVSRGTLVTSPSPSPEFVYVHTDVFELLGRPKFVLVKRDPSLKPEAFFKAKVKVWDEYAVGCHAATYKGNNADNDGDMALVLAYHEPEAVQQIENSLNPEKSFTMGDYGTRWVPTIDTQLYSYVATRHFKTYPDVGFMFRECFPGEFLSPSPDNVIVHPSHIHVVKWNNYLLQTLLLCVRDIFGASAYKNTFEKLTAFSETASIRILAMSIYVDELKFYANWNCSSSLEFEKKIWEFNEPPYFFMALALKSGVLDSAEHIYHACTVYNPGVNLEKYLKAAGDGIINCMKSKELGKAGHAAVQAAASLQSVTRKNNVVSCGDGTVVFDDVLQYCEAAHTLPPGSIAALAASL